jgi:hypothetical protein
VIADIESFIVWGLFEDVEDDDQIPKGKLGTQEVEHNSHSPYDFLRESRRRSDYHTRFVKIAA